MATKAQQFRYEQERTAKPKKKKSPPKRPSLNRPKKKNAVYALEERATATGKASRKSTRGSANHARSDHGLIVREELRAIAPVNRYVASVVKKSTKVGKS